MKIATTSKAVSNFKYQLIFQSSAELIGVNLLYGKKILLKKSFEKPYFFSSKEDVDDIVQNIIKDFLIYK